MRRRRMLAGLLALILAAVALPQHAAAERVVHHSADPETRKIALTFDDGPHPSYTYRILDILDRYGVKATFFHDRDECGVLPRSCKRGSAARA